jgi:Mn2+/Fe2+ NRAMP family transporter
MPAGKAGALRRFWRSLGPGVITGAADDDPSGITTYSIAGAQFGTTLLWTALVTWPLMAAVQGMCARIGMVTGKGLMGALEDKFPRPVLGLACLALLGADGWATLVAILGTTISPYLFFWQASQEVEEEKMQGRHSLVARRGATADEIAARRMDIGAGTMFSNVAMYFIILTTALTLNRHGLTNLQSSREVAQALEPLAGRFSALLYTVGLVGTGLLAIPTLAGSAAYAFAGLFKWREGIDEHFRGAPAFYVVILVALAAGVALDFANVNAVKALFWTAVINGVLAPVLLLGIVMAASDRRLMQGQPSGMVARVVVGGTMVAMFAAAWAMFAL